MRLRYGVRTSLVALLDEMMQKITEVALGHMFRRRKSWTLEPVCLLLVLIYVCVRVRVPRAE